MMYREAIEELKSTLESDQSINLIDFRTFEPVSDDVLNKVQGHIKKSLPKQMVEFYQCTNGLQVRWQWIDNPLKYEHEIKASGSPFPFMWPADHYWQIDGVINILPIDTMFFESYKNFIWFDYEKEYEVEWNREKVNLQQFKKNLCPLDVFDKYYTVAIYIGDEQLPLLLGDDHNADFTHFNSRSFKEYFEFLLRTNGEVAKRTMCFSDDLSSFNTKTI